MKFLKRLAAIVFATLSSVTIFSNSALGAGFGGFKVGEGENVYYIKSADDYSDSEFRIYDSARKILYLILHDSENFRYWLLNSKRDKCLFGISDPFGETSPTSYCVYQGTGIRDLCKPSKIQLKGDKWQISTDRFVKYVVAKDDSQKIKGVITDGAGNKLATIVTEGVKKPVIYTITFLLTAALLGV